jgi:hypothetical protein
MSDDGDALPILLVCAALAALAALIWWSVKRRRELARREAREMFAAYAYRENMDRILAARGIKVKRAPGDNQVVQRLCQYPNGLGARPRVGRDARKERSMRMIGFLVCW